MLPKAIHSEVAVYVDEHTSGLDENGHTKSLDELLPVIHRRRVLSRGVHRAAADRPDCVAGRKGPVRRPDPRLGRDTEADRRRRRDCQRTGVNIRHS